MADEPVRSEIKAVLGWTMAEVAERSSHRLDLSNLQDDDAVMVNVPVAFRYDGPHGMSVPPTRLLSLRATATILTSIEFSPQLEYLDRDAVLALSQRLYQAAVSAGWQPSPGAAVTGPQELAVLLADPSGPDDRSWVVGDLALGDAHLIMRLRRARRPAGGGFGGDVFLLNLNWRDDKLADRADEIVKTLRRQDGVSESVWRKVDAREYGPRAAAMLAHTNR